MINLASKYSEKIQSIYTLSSVIKNRVSNEYTFNGVKSVEVYMPVTQEMQRYDRTKSGNRYGDPKEMEDTLQTLTMNEDWGASPAIDRGNLTEQMGVKKAGKMLQLQIKERMIPAYDRYCLKQFAKKAGTIAAIATAPSKTNILELISDANVVMDDNLVPADNRYIALTAKDYGFVRMSSDYVGNDALGEKALTTGKLGTIFGFEIVKIPAQYMPTDAYFVCWHKDAVLAPEKIHSARMHENPPGLDGWLLELRNIYDAFVLEKKAYGVYAAVKSASITVKPTITVASNKATIASTSSGAVIKYTTDGSDPRYSKSATVYTAAVDVVAGDVVKAYAETSALYASDVAVNEI